MTDSKRHFPLADKRTEIVIVIFKPDPDAGCDLFVVFRAVSGTAGSKESNGFARQTGKEVANLEAAGSAVSEVKVLTPQQYRWLMEGLQIEQPKAHRPVTGLTTV